MDTIYSILHERSTENNLEPQTYLNLNQQPGFSKVPTTQQEKWVSSDQEEYTAAVQTLRKEDRQI